MTKLNTCSHCLSFRKAPDIDDCSVCDNPNSGLVDVKPFDTCTLFVNKEEIIQTGNFKLYNYSKYAGNTSNQLKKLKECSMCGEKTTQTGFFQKDASDNKVGFEICSKCAPRFSAAWADKRLDHSVIHTPPSPVSQLDLF